MCRGSNPGSYHVGNIFDILTSLQFRGQFGFKYVFPQQPGPIVRGLPTAHSASPLKDLIQSKESFVWPDATGEYRGQAIEPLHPGIVNAARIDAKFYELISLADALRIGRTREQSLAIQELKKRI
jgi:hypothetical protein